MSKKRRAVTIDETVDELLRNRDDINASGLVNELLREHFENEGDRAARLISKKEYHLQRAAELKEEIEEKEDKRERALRRAEELEEQLDNLGEDVTVEDARDALEHHDNPTVENDAVQNWAEKLGMAADTLVDELDASTYDQSQPVATDGGEDGCR